MAVSAAMPVGVFFQLVQVAVRYNIILSFMLLWNESLVNGLTLLKDGINEQVEELEIFEGRENTLNCSASPGSSTLSWGKAHIDLLDYDWMTENSHVTTNDRRVSVEIKVTNGFVYWSSMKMTDLVSNDAGKYACYASWGDNGSKWGFVILSVKKVPELNPVCWPSNQTEVSSSSTVAWCEMPKGYPEVNITWMASGTNSFIENDTLHYHTDSSGTELVRSVIHVGAAFQNQVLVCLVTSSDFPHLNRTCSVGPLVTELSTTETLIATRNTPSGTPEGISSATSVAVGFGTTVTELLQSGMIISGGSDVPGSAINTAMVVGAIVGLFACLTVILIILGVAFTRTRQQGCRKGGEDISEAKETASKMGGHSGQEAIPYCVTVLREDVKPGMAGPDVAYGRINTLNPAPQDTTYEVNLDLAAGQVACSKVSTKSANSSSVHKNETVKPDGNDIDMIRLPDGNDNDMIRLPQEVYEDVRYLNNSSNGHKYETVRPDGAPDDNDRIKSLQDVYEDVDASDFIHGSSGRKYETVRPDGDYNGTIKSPRDVYVGASNLNKRDVASTSHASGSVADSTKMCDDEIEGIIVNPIYQPFDGEILGRDRRLSVDPSEMHAYQEIQI